MNYYFYKVTLCHLRQKEMIWKMANSTFINLPAGKKKKIESALLKEFSSYPLAKAQVARIVKETGIARGTFYKYFIDLEDAYHYMYELALKSIHLSIKIKAQFDAQQYYVNVVHFIEEMQASTYAGLIKMHILYNESSPGHPFTPKILAGLDPQNWGAMVLSHATIRLVLANPIQKKAIMTRFKASLELLNKGKN